MFSRTLIAVGLLGSGRTLLSWLGDGLLVLSGMGVAAASASLPFFVAAHPDRFGPPEMAYERVVVELAEAPAIREGSDDDLNQRAIIATPYDDVAVGTISPTARSEQFMARNQGTQTYSPFATSNAFTDWQRDRVTSNRKALAVHNGRAAIVDGGTVRMVRKGSILADGHKVSAVRGDDSTVTLVFEDGSLEHLAIDQYPALGSAQATRK